MSKNYTRENSAKDAFSLWENENLKTLKKLNENIKRCKIELIQNIRSGNINKSIKCIEDLENSIINLHCVFEDWCFEDNQKGNN